MIKQPYQIIKWYDRNGDQEYYTLSESSGYQIPRYQSTLAPSWCVKRDLRVDNLSEWDLISVDGATTIDMTLENVTHPGYCRFKIRTDGADYDYLFYERFPMRTLPPDGLYYYMVSDGIETWYSEVFELCAFWDSIVDDSTNSAPAWDTHTEFYFGNYFRVRLIEVTGNGAENYTNSFDVIYGRKLQLFIYEDLTAKTNNLTVYLEDAATLDVISDVFTIEEGCNEFDLIPEKTCTARLRFELANGVTYSAYNYIWLWESFISELTILNWDDDQNFCDLPFSEGFKNYVVINGQPHQMSTIVEEENDEDDEKNLYPLIQTIQKWYKHTLGGGVATMEGLTILRLCDTVDFTLENGDVINAIDVSLETEPIDDDVYTLTLNYREGSCSKDACTFDISCCCPTVDNVLDYVAGGTGALPAASIATLGHRYLVLDTGKVYIYQCELTAPATYSWVRQTDEEVRNSCVYDEDADSSEEHNQYWAYNPSTLEFQYLCELQGVTDLTDGYVLFDPGDVLGSSSFDCLVYVQGQQDNGGGWFDIGDPVTLDDFASSLLDVLVGAITADFRVRVYTPNCDLMYSNEFTETITEV